jgi:hypothetical protein
MKIKLNSTLLGITGKPLSKEIQMNVEEFFQTLPENLQKQVYPYLLKLPNETLTLKDIFIKSILTPVKDGYSPTGQLISKGDDEKTKMEKWEIYKKIKNEETQAELTVEELKIIKEGIGKNEPPLVMGQCFDLIENKI